MIDNIFEIEASRESASFLFARAGKIIRLINETDISDEGLKNRIITVLYKHKEPISASRKSQQQTEEDSFTALENSITNQAQTVESLSRANGALLRAKSNGDGIKKCGMTCRSRRIDRL